MKSMTGYGSAQAANENYQVEVELKSVNNRFLDLQFRFPKEINRLEAEIRQLAKEKLGRGRIEFYLTLKRLTKDNKRLSINWELTEQLVEQLSSGAREKFGARIDPQDILLKVIDHPDYVTIEETSSTDDSLKNLVLEAIEQAINQLIASREQEGAGILKVLTSYQQDLVTLIEQLQSFVAVYEQDFQKRYEEKLQEYLGAHVERERLLTELAILLERGDIHEEIDRMQIHLKKLAELLQRVEPVGREFDFLLQEMNREINTIGSKSSPIEIKDSVVSAKTIIEKIREQVQNVE